MIPVDVGVFAHNEARLIAETVAALEAQARDGVDLRIVLLANGCTDDTVARARAVARTVEVADLPQGGKSRTWNRFVHDLSRPEAQALVFLDGDIRLTEPRQLVRLAEALLARPGLAALSSRAVKDLALETRPLTPTERLITASAGGLDDWRTALSGSLCAIRAEVARRYHLPIGLPVEDGFLRAMILTDALTGPEDFSRLDGLDGMTHVYESERSVGRLIRHQERIVIGSAINLAVFDTLRDLPADRRHAELARAAADEGWLPRTLRARLPGRSGYVPTHFLTKRLARFAQAPRGERGAKRALLTGVGFGFDALVWLRAQWRMARGQGAGFW